MRKAWIFPIATGLSCAAMIAVAGYDVAQAKQAKKLSYDEAWAACKKFIDESSLSWDQHGQRYTRGAACMAKFGYRI